VDEDKEYEKISRKYVDYARQYTEALQASWKECLDQAAAVTLQAAFEKQAKEKNDEH
jgi:hypothetical protein